MLTLSDILDAKDTAILVIDVQNDFCSPEGASAKAGAPMRGPIEMVPRLVKLLEGARDLGVTIVFVRVVASLWTDSEAWLYRASETPRAPMCREGTWGAEFYLVAPRADEAVVAKHRNSAFYNTRLDTILRALNVKTVVVTGVATNVSVETTARDAVQRDYHVVLVEDCSAAFDPAAHDATVTNIRNFFGRVISASELLDIWGAKT